MYEIEKIPSHKAIHLLPLNCERNSIMKKKLLILAIPGLVFLSCKKDKEEENTETKEIVAVAVIDEKNDSGLEGTITFTEKDGKVTMKAVLKNAEEGKHAMHIHVKGDCSSDDGTSAGGHWNPDDKKHGKWGSDEFHLGDIGNVKADKEGDGTLELTTDLWCIGCDDEDKDILNRAIIVHADEDDYEGDSGNAGARIGCGEILEKK